MWIAIVVGVVILIGLVYWFGFRKPEEAALHEAPEAQKLPKAKQKLLEKAEAEEPRADEPSKAASKPADDKPASRAEKAQKDKEKSFDVVEPQDKPAQHTPEGPASDDDKSEGTRADDEGSSEEKAAHKDSSDEEEGADKDLTDDRTAEAPAPLVARSVEPSSKKRAVDVAGLRKGLGKSRGKEGFFGRLAKLITGHKEINPDIIDEMEEVLITSDVGVKTTEAILERIREGMKKNELDDSEKVWAALRQEALRLLRVGGGGIELRTKPTVVLMVGVNGSGKTTTIGKIATQMKAEQRETLLAAGDTFRAAAVQQLQVWGKRVGCEVVKGKDGADPGAVIFDAIRRGAESGADLILADTAGRLHTKSNLMDELKKVARTMGKAMEGAPHEILLVIDATNGQNALAQSRQFAEALPLSGIVLTKLDGTAKGGVILGICDELKVPVRYIGIGEKADDLRPFDAEEFVEALLGSSESEDIEAA